MPILEAPLPNQPDKLKSIIHRINDAYQQLDKDYHDSKSREEDLAHAVKVGESHNHLLKEEIKLLKARLFGGKSEAVTESPAEQKELFNEAEVEASDVEQVALGEIKVPAHVRKKGGRKPIPDNLPREEVIHDLPDNEKHCNCCGKALPSIGRESSEELTIIPQQVKVIRHIRLKYGACQCEDSLLEEKPEVKIAPAPARMIPQSIVSPSLLAYTITSKFQDALPFYRQSKMFERHGIDISRATLCNWTLKAAEKCRPLIERLQEQIKSSPFIQMDETPVQVLHEPGRKAESKSYMWVQRGSPGGKTVILYHYAQSRSKEIPKQLLSNYKGYLQTDDYAGYDEAGRERDRIHVGCMAHARRKFVEAQKVSDHKPGLYDEALRYIREVYNIERELREKLDNQELSAEAFVSKRKIRVKPLLSSYHRWLKKHQKQVPPQMSLGKAISYSLKNWNKLERYLDQAYLTPDNNLVENVIRPFVVGRKNWLFANTPNGAHASAALYSIIETAKANGLEPYRYLDHLFTHLPAAQDRADIEALLPTKVNFK
jgi:transposase